MLLLLQARSLSRLDEAKSLNTICLCPPSSEEEHWFPKPKAACSNHAGGAIGGADASKANDTTGLMPTNLPITRAELCVELA